MASQSGRLRAGEAAEYLEISRSTLAKWRSGGYGPTFSRIGERMVIYLKADLDAWLSTCAALETANIETRKERKALKDKERAAAKSLRS